MRSASATRGGSGCWHDHLELVYNPEKSLAIGVMIGDAATGNARLHPKNLRKRGAATARAAASNDMQLALFSPRTDSGEVRLAPVEESDLKTWFLVSYRVRVGDVVRIHSELSLPVLEMDGIERMDDDGPGEIDIPVDFR